MKFKILLLSLISLSFSATLFARPLVDSVGVENLEGKKVILHKLDPKDNYYSLGRKYGVSPKVIIQFNNNASMKIGQIIKVPTDRPFSGETATTTTPPVQQPQTKPITQQPVATTPAQQQQTKPVTQQPVTTQPTVTTTPPTTAKQIEQKTAQEVANSNAGGITTQQYKVSAGETLYSIAKRFGTTVDDITAVNKLTSSIVPGQVLTIRSGVPPTPPPPAPVQQPDTSSVAKRDSTNAVSPADSLADKRGNKYGLFEKNEKGVATWIDDATLDPNKKLILHRTAPIGTVMRITNPMTNKTTFAKVVGRFTDNQATKDVVVVMTKNVAESLGALDKRFHVNISYGTPNE